jgi:solute carrier family 25 thiamine pyrophosphate transporter 19
MHDRGIAGLYAGVGVTLMEIIPASAIQFGSYAALKAAAMRAGGGLSNGNGELSSGGNMVG